MGCELVASESGELAGRDPLSAGSRGVYNMSHMASRTGSTGLEVRSGHDVCSRSSHDVYMKEEQAMRTLYSDGMNFLY